jgi:serine/threonine-protein kinase
MSEAATGAWREALGLIDTLLSEPVDAREKLLANLAASRPDLHVRVRALLDADAQATRVGFMSVRRDARTDGTAALQVGARLGPYRMVREIGQGGMGEVWLARRDDGLYEGEVAIKTLHPFFAHGAMRERFLREAQLLGKLAHPNIARLLDAGVDDGVVFIVLEFVDGEPIDVYCDARSLTIDARVRIFVDVCAAVAHAHANLVVHRDIKPSNILVTPQGQVKLLDFGIGKLMEADNQGAARTELTRMTGRIFTPEFAAPEQILGEAVTTATDVYSLGTLLYVLLAGVRPFGGDVSGARAEHAVLHEEPVALSRAGSQADEKIAALRGTTPHRLQRVLANDLEDIVHLAMRKLPKERYGSVLALGDDLARYTRHEPVAARAGSRAYRMNRFVRRHRVAVAATAGVVLAATLGVAGVLYQAREAREQARVARLEAGKATAVKDYLLKIFEANSARHPGGARARQTTAEELMDLATAQILQDTGQDPALRLELMTVLYGIVIQMRKEPQQEALVKERIRVAEKEFGVADVRLADAYNDYSEVLRVQQKFDEARAAATKAVQLREAQGDRTSWTRGVSEVQLGQINYGDWDGVGTLPIDHQKKAIEILSKHPPTYELVRAYLGLARAYEFLYRYDESIAANEKGIALGIQVVGARSSVVAGGHQQLSRALVGQYRFAEAEEHLRQAVEMFTFVHGAESGFTTLARLDVGRILARRGRHRAAAEELEKVLAIRERADGPTNTWVVATRTALVSPTLAIGDFARARAMLDANKKILADSKNARMRANIARLEAALAIEENRPAEALKVLDEAAAQNASAPGPSALSYMILINRIDALASLGRVAEARASVAQIQDLLIQFDKDPARADTLFARIAEAHVELAEKRYDIARVKIADVLAQVQASPRRAEIWILEELAQRRLAAAELGAGNKPAACASLDVALALRTANALSSDPRIAATRALKTNCT